MRAQPGPDDGYELSVTRLIAASPATVWDVWTRRLEDWWAPRPWTTRIVANDLRPGGRMVLATGGPNGEMEPMEGVYLEVVPERSIVFTNAFRADWIPQAPFMVGFFRFAAEGAGTRYTAGARHWDEAALKQHEAMGFATGWAAVAEQFAGLAEG